MRRGAGALATLMLLALASCADGERRTGPGSTPGTGTAAEVGRTAGADAPSPLLAEDFSTYTSTADMLADPRDIYAAWGDRHASRIFLDDAVGAPAVGSGRSMRYDWPADAFKDYELGRVLHLPEQVPEVWVEVWLRFSEDFTTEGPHPGNPDYKTLFAHTTPDGSGRFELKVATGGGHEIRAGEAAAGPYQEIRTGQHAVSELDHPGEGRYWDGRWYRYRLHFKVDSGAGNGAVRLWIMPEGGSDVLHVDERGADFAGRYTGVDMLYLGANMNRGTGRTMSAWWGGVRVWDRDPGW